MGSLSVASRSLQLPRFALHHCWKMLYTARSANSLRLNYVGVFFLFGCNLGDVVERRGGTDLFWHWMVAIAVSL
jgi:hypothetical protein